MNLKVALRDMGIVLEYSSISFLFPVIAALIYKEHFTIKYFLLAAAITFLLGFAIKIGIRTGEKTQLKEGMLTVALMWLIIPLISAIPYLGLTDVSILQAFFETMSAWTTTGFSILVPEALSKTMLFFRSWQQWLGGVGIIVIALGGIFSTSASLYYAEARNEKIRPNILNTIKMIWWIYVIYTIAGSVLLAIAGMTPFDAINHSMTSIATGGLSTHSESIGYYHSTYIEFVTIIIMVVGSISFLSHYDLRTGNIRKFLSDVFIRSFIVMLIISTALMSPERGFRTAIFTATSAASSTGFNLDTIDSWPGFSLAILIILMIVGGCAGATAGGIKINRVFVAAKSLVWSAKRIKHPRQVFSKKIGDSSYSNDTLIGIFKFMFLYLIFTVAGALVFLHEGYGFGQSVFQSASAIGNGGLSMISEYTPISMATATFLMWVGRLEIWSALVFIGYIAFKLTKSNG